MYKEEDFDIMVKSTLESGTEDVPAHLWDGVQKRIDAAPPVRVPRHPLWKRWTVGIAFVCVAACCLLLLTPHREENAAPAVVSVPDASPVTIAVVSAPDAASALVEAVVPVETIVPIETVAPVVASAPDAAPVTVATASVIGTGTAEMAEMAETEKTATTAEIPEPSEHIVATGAGETENNTEPPGTTVPAQKTETSVSGARPQTMSGGQFAIFEPEQPARQIRYALTGSATSGSHAGGRSSIAERMSTSQMDFGSEEKIYESTGTFYMMPVSAGLGVRINFTKHWALGVGLNYTYLHRRFEGLYDYGGTENYYCDNISNSQHYIGIPINAYYNIIGGNRLKFYVYAGGTVEKCVSNSYSFNYYGYTKVLKQSVGGLQASVNAGLGLQFCITDRFGIYLDPSFRYYFRNYLQPKSIRTAQPFQINAELGLRWDL